MPDAEVNIVQVFPDDPIHNEENLNRIWVAEIDGEPIGEIKLDYLGQGESRIAFASNLIVKPGSSAKVASMLIQRLLNEARSQGYKKVTFAVEPNQPDLLCLVESGKAFVTHVWCAVNL